MHYQIEHRKWARAIVIISIVSFTTTGCQRNPLPAPENQAATTARADADTNDDQVIAFCGSCHAMPDPQSFPKSAWYDEVKRGFGFYYQSKRTDLHPPSVQPVVDYFRSRASASLTFTSEKSVPNPDRVRFRMTEFSFPKRTGDDAKPVAISFIGNSPSASNKRSDLILSDMANGPLILASFTGGDASPVVRSITQMRNPAAVSRCDLDGNGKLDLVVADLGSFTPGDHDRGRVAWLPDFESAVPEHPAATLIDHLGRVADVQPADFDGDGDIDLVVAEFGWHQTGRVTLLRNGGSPTEPRFELEVVDPRPGAIHVPVVDLNRDGKPDFVALISQEFEVIEAFLNRGDGTFQKQRIDGPQDPAFGSSGIQLGDLDGDGDLDVLSTNGDMFDSFLIKPYHGIRWLENRGQYPFVPHHLTAMPGVHRALAGDLDRDGDLDIVACSLLPGTPRDSESGQQLESVIWLEQTAPGQFVRHAIETGNCIHAALELVDLDEDGDLDIVAGAFRDRAAGNQSAVAIWWNETIWP